MKRPWHVWLIYSLSLFALLGGLTWITVVALKLDAAEQQAQARGQWEEDVRLALWRMDFHLTAMISTEASRPYFVYSSAYPPYRAYAHMFSESARSKGGTVDPLLMPSPLLLSTPAHVKLHFQVTPSGDFSSPQAPDSSVRDLVNEQIATPDRWEYSSDLLASLQAQMSWPQLTASVPEVLEEATAPLMAASGGPAPQQADFPYQSGQGQRGVPQQLGDVDQPPRPNVPPQQSLAGNNSRSRATPEAQQAVSQQEFLNRFQGSQNSIAENSIDNMLPNSDDVRASIMRPAWLADNLFLLRRVKANNETYIQGVWLDWDSLRAELLGLVADMFPDASLSPVAELPAVATEGSERMLAVLPARLSPGKMALPPLEEWTPIRIALLAAWLCMLLAAAAVASLLTGVLRLSERRATFVSAVTHELRTPLTTFRMYSEMLSSGMVTEESRRNQYLETLRLEADRLGHLVENVLSFARLERTRTKDRSRTIGCEELIEKIVPRLRDRTSRSDMDLDTSTLTDLPKKSVKAEEGAVEQILINLVDNACKYASSARPSTVRVDHQVTDAGWEIRICDHGPGISRHEARSLFRPFTKSASDAAHSAPGVGLGLALSKRLARELRGDLTLDYGYSEGACFVLTLPWA